MEDDLYSEDRIPCSICGRSFAPEVLKKHSNVCKKSAATAAKRKPFDSSKQRVLEGELSLKQIKEAQKKLRILCTKKAQNLHWPAVVQEILDLNPDKNPDTTVADRTIELLELTVDNLDNFICQATENLKDGQACSASEIKPPKSHWREKHQDFINAVRNARGLQQAISSGGPLPPPPPPSSNPDYVQCPHCSRRFNQSAAERHISFCKDKQSKLPKDKPGSSTSAKQNTRVNYQPAKPKAKTSNPTPSTSATTSSTGPARPALTATKASLKGPAPATKTPVGGPISLPKNSTLGSNSSTRQTSSAKVPTGVSSSTTRVATGGSASSTRIATSGSASSTRIAASGTASTTRITPAIAAPSTKLGTGGPAASSQIPAGEATSSTKKPAGSLPSSSRIPAGSSTSSTKIPSGNAAPSTGIPVGAAPSSGIPVGGAALTTGIPVGGVARGKAAPVAKHGEPINLDKDKVIATERLNTAGPAKYTMISRLSFIAESDFSVSVDHGDAAEAGQLMSGESQTDGLDLERFSSPKSANKERRLHKKRGPQIKTEPYCYEEDLVKTLFPLPLNESQVSVHHLRHGKHEAADPRMIMTPAVCSLPVKVTRLPEDLSSQLHHHHVSLHRQLLDQELLPGYTQLHPNIQLHRHPHQAGPANNYFRRYNSSLYEILHTGCKMYNNYIDAKDSFPEIPDKCAMPLTNPLSCCFNTDSLDSSLGDTNVFKSARCSDNLEIVEAKFCCHCGVRFPVSSAKFCCQCGMRRLKSAIEDFRNNI